MAGQYQHKRYFKLYNNDTSSYETFSSIEDAQTKLAFGSCFDTSSPTKTYSLEDSGQTLVVKYKFNSNEEQMAFKDAIGTAWASGTALNGNTAKKNPLRIGNPDWESVTPANVEVLQCRHVKTEWLFPDGSVSSTYNPTFE